MERLFERHAVTALITIRKRHDDCRRHSRLRQRSIVSCPRDRCLCKLTSRRGRVEPATLRERRLIKRRRRFKQTTSLEQRISQFADELRAEASASRSGSQTDPLLKRIRQAEAALHLNEMLTAGSIPTNRITSRLIRKRQNGQPEQ
jgi:hypothetical protein